MKLLLSVFATLALTSTPKHQAAAQEPEYLKLTAYGDEIQIANVWEQYDQNQNHAEGSNPTFAADHLSITTVGNRWSSYAIPTTATGPVEILEDSVLQFDFTLGASTVSGFQAVCVDFDREITGSNGQCFVLSTSQGWIDNMLNVAKQTNSGETTFHSIPIGHFFTGPINYLAILQDSDGDATAKAAGNFTFSNFEIIERGRIPLNVEINGVDTPVENEQFSMTDSGQDTTDNYLEISEDGESIQVNGNQWKALKFTNPYNITYKTVLEFDVIVSQPGDFHSICLDDDLSTSGVHNCVTFVTPTSQKIDYLLTTTILMNTVQHLVVPFGQIFRLLEGDVKVANYLGFVQDNDVGDKRGGQMTFSSFRLYEDDRPPISIDLYGTETFITNIQDSHTSSGSDTYVQDSFDHVMSVSGDGKNITAHGNSFKRFKLDAPFEIFPSSILKFTFSLIEGAEIQAICLLAPDEINMQDGRNDCFATAGPDSASSSSLKQIRPLTDVGETREYEIYVGSYFTGQVGYIAFAQDNDKSYTTTRAEGEATWSDIQITRLPDLNIGFDSAKLRLDNSQLSVAIENNQVTYESTSQDTTPIKDYLAKVSDDGNSITVNGNMWRAFPFNPPIDRGELRDFIVSFDYVVKTPGDFHAVCFEENLEYGNADNPLANGYDPKRCFVLNDFEDLGRTAGNLILDNYYPQIGEPHRYVRNLSKIYDRFDSSLGYFVIIQDNDVDKAVGEMVVSNINIITDLTSCLKTEDFSFNIMDNDCTIDNFLASVQTQMVASSCTASDPLLELLAFFDVKEEMEVYKEIEHICNSSYEPHEFDFTKTISAETQLVREYIDGGSSLNYESDAAGDNANLLKDAAGIGEADGYASSHLFTWPKHHALDQCDVGAAMCCWVDSRGTAVLENDSDVCYVNMKSSRRTAHVADGYSIYGQGDEGNVSCHGFAWGADKASTASALKGNALFKVGFMDSLYAGLKGSVEQVPGAPMCGCIDRMPVVTKAKCTKVSAPTSTVTVSHTAAVGKITAAWDFGVEGIVYEDCGEDLNAHYKTLVDPLGPDAAYIDSRLVGEGNCPTAINDFLSTKGLVMQTA